MPSNLSLIKSRYPAKTKTPNHSKIEKQPLTTTLNVQKTTTRAVTENTRDETESLMAAARE
jgi:hypothetical protein